MSLLPMNTYDMAHFCHKTTNFSPDIEELDIKIVHHNENIEDLENILIRKKLYMCNIDLKNAQYKLLAQERELRSLRDRNKQLNKEGGVDNEEQGVCYSETLFDIERNNACLHTSDTKEDDDVSAQNQTIDNLTEETRSLKRKMNNKEIEISQLRFRSKLLVDTLEKRKLGKDNTFYTLLDENEFLQEQMAFLKEENLKKDEELSKVIFDLKKAHEWNAHMTTENCTLKVKLTEHERQIRELEETNKYVKFLKDEVQRALNQSLRKEAELKGTLLQLNDKDKETENKIHTMTNRLNRYIGIIHDNEAEIERVTGSCQRKIQQLEARLEQSHQDVIKGKEQANIAQDRMSKEMENLKIEMNEKETLLKSIDAQIIQSIKTNEDKEAEIKGIISQQNGVIKHLQTELKSKPQNHTIETQLKHALKELELSKCNIEHEREKAATLQKQINKMFKDNETLKLEISGKDKEIQQLNDNSQSFDTWKREEEAQMISIMNDAKRQNVHLQEQLKQSCDEMALLRQNCSELTYSNQQKDIQISEMKHEIERNIKLLQERESVLATTNDLLKKQFKDAGYELETCKQEIKREKNQSNIEITKLRSEIKCLNLKIKEKESELLRLGVEFAEQEKQKQKEKNKLRDIQSKHFKQIKDLEKELEKRNVKIFALEQVTKQKNQLKQALKKSDENDVAVCLNVEDLTFKLNEKDKQISKLTQYLKIASESLENMKSEFMNIEDSSEKKVDQERDHYQLEITQEKEQLATNKMQNVSTHKHKDCEMENEVPMKNRNETQQSLVKSAESEGALRKTINELQILGHSLKMQKNKAEERLRECKQEMEHENEQLHIIKFQMCKEIEDLKKELTIKEERLKVEVKIKETLLQEYNAKLKDAVKVKEETESNLKEIINKQNEDINHLKAKIEMQNYHNITIDEVENHSKQIQQALNESQKKETEFERTIDILQRKDNKNEGQIRELRDQLNELSNASKRKKNILQSMNTSLQTQLNTTESKLKELHLGQLHEEESLSTHKKQMVGLNKEIESLKEEVKLKEARINEYNIQCKDALKTKQEAECKLNEIISKQNNEIHYLQKQIEKKDIEANDIAQLKKHSEEVQRAFNDLCKKEAELLKSNKDLHCRNREKEDEVRELKKQLSEMLKTASQKENESRQIIHSIEQQLKNTEANMKQQQLGISQEKQLMSTKVNGMVKMTEEINSLKLQVEQNESTLQTCSEQYKDAVKLKQEAESKLNEIIQDIIIHKTDIGHLQEDIERKDNEIARLEQINARYEKVRSTLNESQEKELTLRKTIKELQKKSQENENRISELKRKLDKTSEESHKIEYELKETIHLLDQKNKSIETEKDQYKQDIANAKHLSKAAQMKMSEMDTRINDLTNKLKKKERDPQKGKENLRGIIDSQKDQIQHLEREVQKRERKMKSVQIEKDNELQEMKKNVVELENQMKHMLSKLRDKEAELDETKSRLSRVMGDRLSDNNPNITDLSDRNRPTKIAEKFAELYDIEWTDAFDVLEKLYRTEESAIEALLLILQNAMHFCETMAQRQIEFIEREMYFADEKEKITVSSDIQKLIKDRRKATATAVVGNLKKIYVAQLKQSKDQIMRAALDIEPYTSECIEICWLMLTQDPPVVFAPLPIKGSSFDTNFYKPYTKSGTHIDFAVWPSLLLHDGGPILAKGMAQGYENN